NGFGFFPPTTQATDGQGDVFFVDTNGNQVLETLTDGTTTPVGSGLNQPIGLALDSQGDLFIADSGNARVVEVKVGVPVSVSPANAHPSVIGYNVTYNGAPYTAVGSATDVNGNPLPTSDFDLSGTVHTGAGGWIDAWSFHDPSGNYQDANGTVS